MGKKSETGKYVPLDVSYSLCVETAKKRAGNFFFAFRVLPKERFRGICALYACTRRADDIADGEAEGEAGEATAGDASDPAVVRAQLKNWRRAFDQALAGKPDADPLLPAVADTFHRFAVPPRYLHELIAGCEMDALQTRYEQWENLRLYCYRVASVVGLMTLHIFGFADDGTGKATPEDKTLDAGERLGLAFQLTNILRDVKEDGERGRIYLPLEELHRFNVSEDELLRGRDSPEFRRLILFEAQRAAEFYKAADELLPKVSGVGRPALAALTAIYRRLLEEIVKREGDVLSRRVSLSKAEKIRLAAAAALTGK